MLQYISFQTNIHHWWLLLLRKPKPRSQYPLATDTRRHLDQNPSTGRFWVLEGTLGNTWEYQDTFPGTTMPAISPQPNSFTLFFMSWTFQKSNPFPSKTHHGLPKGEFSPWAIHVFFVFFLKFLTLSTKIKSKMASENFFGSPTIWKNCCCIFEWGGLLEPKFLGCWSHHWCLDRQGSETQIHRRAFEWLAGGVWKSCPKVDTYYWTSVGIYLFW